MEGRWVRCRAVYERGVHRKMRIRIWHRSNPTVHHLNLAPCLFGRGAGESTPDSGTKISKLPRPPRLSERLTLPGRARSIPQRRPPRSELGLGPRSQRATSESTTFSRYVSINLLGLGRVSRQDTASDRAALFYGWQPSRSLAAFLLPTSAQQRVSASSLYLSRGPAGRGGLFQP